MKYTTRVELHRASDDDYDTLHAAMADQGFSRQVEKSDGTSYHLPTAEYSYDGSASRAKVLERAKTAAATTGRTYCVLVTESNGRSWYNLKEA
jgi:hypothetical protein